MAVKHVVGRVTPIKDHILVQNMEFGERKSSGGIIIPGDDADERGIRARWAQVYAVGPLQTDVKVGEWVLVKHGRWTRGVDVTDNDGNTVTIRRVDNDDVLLVSEHQHHDDTVSMSK